MGKKNAKSEEKKVRASDFSSFHTSDSRPTGLHQIFAAFNNIARSETTYSTKSEAVASTDSGRTADDHRRDLSQSQGDVLALLNKLTKKDSVTKLKALETFNQLIEDTHERVLEDFIVDIIHLFRKSALVEPVKKIRLEYGILLSKIAPKLKRKLQQYLESFITLWWVSMHDESADIAEAYEEAFRNLFSTPLSKEEFELKTLKILDFYFPQIASEYLQLLSRDLDSYTKDWLDTFGKSSQNSASIADMHNRLFYSLLHSLRKLFVYARVHSAEVKLNLDSLVTDKFVALATEISRSSAFKKKLSCVLMMVEMVKVLPSDKLPLLETILANAVSCVKMETEPALIYHNVRLICACTRENNAALAKFLPNYEEVVMAVLTNFNGEYGNKVDLFTLFPSMYIYLDTSYFDKYRHSFEEVLTFLADLMAKEVASLRRNSYTFDLCLFRNLGTSMLISFYKLLLISKITSVEQVALPLRRLLPMTDNARDFLWNYPQVLTEYVAEVNLLEERSFQELLSAFLAFSEESTVLIASVLDALFDKHGAQLVKVSPGFEKQYQGLLQEVTAKLPGLLEDHLEHKADLTLDIDQVVQLLKKNSLLLPHSIPALLFKSKSHSEFAEDYKLLLQVYRTINSPLLKEALSEDLDPRLKLFYAVVLVHKEPEAVKPVFSTKFDLKEPFTSLLVAEFVNGCRGLGFSNELLPFASSHLNLELLESVLEAMDYGELTEENGRQCYALLLLYQLYAGKHIRHGGSCDLKMAAKVLTLYLYQVLNERVPEFASFAAFVLEECSPGKEGFADPCLETLDSMHATHVVEFDAFASNLAKVLTQTFDPDFIVDALERAVGLCRAAELSAVYKRSYHLVVAAYLKSERATGADEESFLDVLVCVLSASDQSVCVPAHRDFTEIVAKYRMDEKRLSQKLLHRMIEKLMTQRYESSRRLNQAVKVFQYFYGVLRNNLEGKKELVDFIRSHFSLNLSPSYFLASVYAIEPPSESEVALELIRLAELAYSLKGRTDSERVDEGEGRMLVNCATIVTQILVTRKNFNNADRMKPEELQLLLVNADKRQEHPHSSDYADAEVRGKNQSELPARQPNLELLPSTLLALFVRIELGDLADFSWAHIALFNFLALFPAELDTDRKNDHLAVSARCLEVIYGSHTLHPVSVTLLVSLINLQLDKGLVTQYSLRVDPELDGFFKSLDPAEADLAHEFGRLDLSTKHDARSLAFWLAVCLRVGSQALRLEDPDLARDLASTVSLLMQHTQLLQPGPFYVNAYASHLWDCRAFYPAIADAGVFCTFPNHEYSVVINTFPESDFFGDLNGCKIDLFKLLYTFNNYSNLEEGAEEPEDEGQAQGSELTLEDLEEDELKPQNPQELAQSTPVPSVSVSMEDVRNAYDLMKLYFSAVIGPYLTGQIMRTYEYLETSETQEIEKCLISWLTVFSLHAKYKRLGNVNCSNALVKLLTSKPQDVAEYINDAFQENLAEAIEGNHQELLDLSFVYSERFGLTDLYPEDYYSQDLHSVSLLDQFLQLLILCLERMLIKDEHFCQTVKLLYYRAAKIFPMQVAEMWSNCKNAYVKKNIKKFTKHEVTQKLVRDELEALKSLTSDLTVFYDTTKKEVSAKLQTKSEITAKIAIRVPSAFPLEPLTFVSNETKKNHKWIMFSHSEANRSGIAQGLMLWYNNVVKYYQGIDECPICYSIVHTQFQSIPTKQCKVCKYKFHKECLFKWFRNAAKAKCPLCQSQVSFL